MLVNIDIAGDILIQAETDFEREYVKQFDGCVYGAFVKTGFTASEITGLKLRKTSGTGAEQPPNSAIAKCLHLNHIHGSGYVQCLDCKDISYESVAPRN